MGHEGQPPSSASAEQLERIYRELPREQVPWHHDKPPQQLVELVASGWARPCATVELGCGAGTTAVWLARQGFRVTGLDVAPSAIAMATERAAEAAVTCRFETRDLTRPITDLDNLFDLATDWEVLHHIAPPDRPQYLANIHRMLRPHGRYASVTFSVDDPFGCGDGPIRTTPLGTTLYFTSEDELRTLYEPLFEIEDIATISIRGSRRPHLALAATLHRRAEPTGQHSRPARRRSNRELQPP